MDKDHTVVIPILIEQEHLLPILVQRLEETHNFDYYVAVLWCLQILAARPNLRDEMIALNIIPITLKVKLIRFTITLSSTFQLQIFDKTSEPDIPLRLQSLTFTCNLLQASPIPPYEVVRPLLVNIVMPTVDSPKCRHSALTAIYFFTLHIPESAQREAYLLEVFRSDALLKVLVEQAQNISQVKICQVARRVIENLSSTNVKENVDKLIAFNVADALVQELHSPRPPALLSAVRTVTNLGSVSREAVQYFLTSDVYTVVCRAYSRIPRKDFVREAAFAVKHALTGAPTGKQIENLIHAGCLPVICDTLLDTSDVEAVGVALTTLFVLLHKCPSVAVYDDVIRLVYELDGWKAVDKFKQNEDVRVRDKAEKMNIVAIRALHWPHSK